MKKFFAVILSVMLVISVFPISAYAQESEKVKAWFFILQDEEIPEAGKGGTDEHYKDVGTGYINYTGKIEYNKNGLDNSIILEAPELDLADNEEVVWYEAKKQAGGSNGRPYHVDGVIVKKKTDTKPTTKPDTQPTTKPDTQPTTKPTTEADKKTKSIRIDTPLKMAVRFEDGSVYYDGQTKDITIGKEYKFQMCSVNWENGKFDDNGNGIAGTVVYTMKAVRRSEFLSLRKKALEDTTRYTVKGIDIIDNEAKTIIINCDEKDFHLETDVNNFFIAYRYHFNSGDYNKQTGIEHVVNTPIESLSVNLPLGSSVKSDAYKAYEKIGSDEVFIERNNGKGAYAGKHMSSVNDYYWNF